MLQVRVLLGVFKLFVTLQPSATATTFKPRIDANERELNGKNKAKTKQRQGNDRIQMVVAFVV